MTEIVESSPSHKEFLGIDITNADEFKTQLIALQRKHGVSGGRYNFYQLLTQKLSLEIQAESENCNEHVKNSGSKSVQSNIINWLSKPLKRDAIEAKKNSEKTNFQHEHLQSLITAKANQLISQGVKPGELIALVDLTGVNLLVGILATLKLGCIYTVLSSCPVFIFEVCKALIKKNDPHGIGIHHYLSNDGEVLYKTTELDDKVQSIEGDELFELPPHHYESGSIVCITFDEETEQNCQPWKLTAKELYSSLLINGLCLFGKIESGRLLIPENCKPHYHPSLLLTSLLFGITPVLSHSARNSIDSAGTKVTENQLGGSSYILFELDKAIRYAYLLESWEIESMQAMTDFMGELGKENIETDKIFLLRFLSVCQGFTLLGKLQKQGGAPTIHPLPGRKFSLRNALLTDNVETRLGLFALNLEDKSVYISHDLITDTLSGYLYQEWAVNKLNQVPYPTQAITHALKNDLLAVEGQWPWLDIYILPAHITADKKIHLLALYLENNLLKQDKPKLKDSKLAIKARIENWFKSGQCINYLPDEVHVIHYYPGKSVNSKSELFHQWQNNYLENKEKQYAFTLISLLRKKIENIQ